MKEKIIKDGNHWSSYVLMSIGVLIGMIFVTILKNGELSLINLSQPLGFTATLLLVLSFLRIGVKRVYKSEQ